MANNIKQGFIQIDVSTDIPKRIVSQYYDDIALEDNQSIVNYDDLTTAEKATFDAFKTLCESKI